jgi:hypothetical protein
MLAPRQGARQGLQLPAWDAWTSLQLSDLRDPTNGVQGIRAWISGVQGGQEAAGDRSMKA